MDAPCDVIIVAAGSGRRLGGSIPKAFASLHGIPLFLHSVRAFAAHPLTARIILVVAPEMIAATRDQWEKERLAAPLDIVEGGAQRWQSVYRGVARADAAWVMVHDAARPFISARVIDALLAERNRFSCVITATPVVDTIRKRRDDRCDGVIDRSTVLRVGTPQAFHRETLLRAFAARDSGDPEPTDEAMLMESIGVTVGYAWGDPLNFKITTPEDFTLAEALCAWMATRAP